MPAHSSQEKIDDDTLLALHNAGKSTRAIGELVELSHKTIALRLKHLTPRKSTEIFKEKEGIIFIDSIIYVERDTQKGIIIGNKGDAIKKVGTEARIDLEKFFSKKIHLNLFVKVKKDWRKNERDLKNFGYR